MALVRVWSPPCIRHCCCHCFFPTPLLLRNRTGLLPSRRYTSSSMDGETLSSLQRNQASLRLCNVSSFSTELLELHSDRPLLHVLLIPGNPGIVSFYKDFVEEVYKLLEGKASVTAIGHISHTGKDLENGRTFSLQEQINHKVYFIKQDLQKREVPIVMVGHSIGSYICLEILKKLDQQVKLTIGLYPFLTLNRNSLKQSVIGFTARSPFLCTAISSIAALLGLCPTWVTTSLLKRSIGKSWSATAVEATCSHLVKYHTVRNVLFMADTEFKKLSEEPDWTFMRQKQSDIALLFSIDDHWGPLSLFEEISRRVPDIALSIEREGHTHAFCCAEAGSFWVANHVVNLIKNHHEVKL